MKQGGFILSTVKCSAFERLARFRRDPFPLLIVVLAGLGTAHILARTALYGPAVVDGDSVHYLSTAINFLAGEGWQDFMGYPMMWWPPLFPLLLAAGGWLGIEPFAAGRWINATAFGLTIFAAGCWLRSNLRSRGLALAATGAIAASVPLSELASYFLTDSLFVLLTLLALIQLAAFLQRGGRTLLGCGAIFTALAALTRYLGVVLIGTGVLLLLVRRTSPLATRLKDTIVFGAISSLPLAGWLTRNWAVSGTLTGKRGESGQSLSDPLSRVADIFWGWLIPLNALDGFDYLLWPAAGLVVAVSAVVVVGSQGQTAGKGSADVAALGLGAGLPFGGFTLAYLGFMVAIVPLVVPVPIPTRYLLPVYVPLLLVAVLLLDRFLSIETTGRMAVAKWGLASLVLLGGLAHVSFSAHRNLRLTPQEWRAGFESWPTWPLNNSYWESFKTRNYIRTNRIEGRVYAKHPFLVWFWDRSADPGKYLRLPSLHKMHKFIPRIMRKAEGDSAHIVWLLHENENSVHAYDIDIRCLPGVEPVAERAIRRGGVPRNSGRTL